MIAEKRRKQQLYRQQLDEQNRLRGNRGRKSVATPIGKRQWNQQNLNLPSQQEPQMNFTPQQDYGDVQYKRAKQLQYAQELKQQINQTDKEIDQMVYELYGLTEEEIKIVEES